MSDPTDLRDADAREAREALEAKRQADREIADFLQQMSTQAGRRFVFGLLDRTGLYRSSFTSNRSVTDFNEGQRNVGLYYMEMVNAHCLDEYVLMLKEHAEHG